MKNEYQDLANFLQQAKDGFADFQRDVTKAGAFEWLRIIQDEIIRRLLMAS